MNDELPVEEKKPSLFKKIIDLIHSVWPKTDETDSYRAISRFKIKAEDMLGEDLPETILHAAALYEEALKIARRRIHTSKRITAIESDIHDVEALAKLTPEETVALNNLLDTFLSVTRDRDVLRYQLVDFDKGVDAIARLEEDANEAIPKIQDAERMQRILKRDVGLIEGERLDLEYERDKLYSGMVFTDRLTFGAAIALTLTSLALGYLAVTRGERMFYPLTALTFATILILCTIYMFRRRINFELRLNARKQSRAVELMNKKNAVLAYHTNFLNFAYKKYKVRNAQALIKNLSEYEKYKHVTGRLDSIRDIMYETERRIEQFMRERNIESGKLSLEQFAKNINIQDKQRYYIQLVDDLRKLEAGLQEMDLRHQDIWEYLEALRAEDTTGVLEALSQLYIDEVALAMGAPDPLQEEDTRLPEQKEEERTDEEGTGQKL